jgi:hypothetical protein
MLPFRVVVKPYLRPDLAAAHPHPNSFSITLIQPLSFLTFTHSSAQRTTPIYFSFNHLHTLSTATEGVGGTPPPRRSNVSAYLLLSTPFFLMHLRVAHFSSPFFSYPCALFCAFLHLQETQPPCFQSFPHSASKKHPGGGYPRFPRSTVQRRLSRSQLVTSHESPVTSLAIRPIAANVLWCNNPERHKESLRSGETTPLPPVSNNTERTSGTVRRRSRLHPDSVGVASRAWVQRSNAGFRVCTYKP